MDIFDDLIPDGDKPGASASGVSDFADLFSDLVPEDVTDAEGRRRRRAPRDDTPVESVEDITPQGSGVDLTDDARASRKLTNADRVMPGLNAPQETARLDVAPVQTKSPVNVTKAPEGQFQNGNGLGFDLYLPPEEDRRDLTDDMRASRKLTNADRAIPGVNAVQEAPRVAQERFIEDPTKGDDGISRGQDLGRRVARGATEVAGSIPEATAILGREILRDRYSSAIEAVGPLYAERKQLVEIIESNQVDSPEARAAQMRLTAVEGQIIRAARMVQEDNAALATPVSETALFKAGDILREVSLEVFGEPDKQFDDKFVSKLAEGGGSMLGFVLATIGTGVVGGAVAGSAVSSSEMYKRAKAGGATEEQALEAAFYGRLIGLTEVVPIVRALDKLPAGMRSRAKTALAQRLRNIARGSFEEGIQEGGTGLLKNLVEKKIWNPEKEIFTEDVAEEALIGAILGGGLSAVGPARLNPEVEAENQRKERAAKLEQYRLPEDGDSPLADLAAEGRMAIDEMLSSEPPAQPEVPAQPEAPAVSVDGAPDASVPVQPVAPEVGQSVPFEASPPQPEVQAEAPSQPQMGESTINMPGVDVPPPMVWEMVKSGMSVTFNGVRISPKAAKPPEAGQKPAAQAAQAPVGGGSAQQAPTAAPEAAPAISGGSEARTTLADDGDLEVLPEIEVNDETGESVETGKYVLYNSKTGERRYVDSPDAVAPEVDDIKEQLQDMGDLQALTGFEPQDTLPDLQPEQRASLERGEIPAGIGANAFLYKTSDSTTISMADVDPIRARPTGIANARKLMAGAPLSGNRRQPITVKRKADGRYELLDGSSTYAVLNEAGVESVEVRVLTDEQFAEEAQLESIRKIIKDPAKKKRRVDAKKAGGRFEQAWEAARRSQPFDAISDMVGTEAQAQDQADLDSSVRDVASGVSGASTPYPKAPAKELESAQRKVDTKYGGDHRMLGDTVRQTFVVDSVQDGDAVVDALAERYSVIDEGYATTDAGYVDRKVSVLMPSGRWAEVQILPPGMLEANQSEGHALYEISRDEKKPATERQLALQKQKSLYGGVVAKLDPSWTTLIGQSRNSASPSRPAATSRSNSSSVISGERSSDKMTDRETGQERVPANMVAVPSSSMRTTPGSESKKRGMSGTPSSSTSTVADPAGSNSSEIKIKDESAFSAFKNELRARLKQMMIRNVPLTFEGDLPARGATEIFSNGDMAIIIGQTSDAMNTLNHEAIHVLRGRGLFSEAEWATLSKEAEAVWLRKYRIKERYRDLDADAQVEEAVAQAFADFVSTGRAPKSSLQKIFAKVRRFFNAVRTAMGAARINSVEDVFDMVDRGDIGARDSSVTKATPRRIEQRGAAKGEMDDKAGRDAGQAGRETAPLAGAPTVEGASGPDARLVAVAEEYAKSRGIDLRRQSEFAKVDPEFAARVADAYEQMEHNPSDPVVKEAFDNLIAQTKDQYQALVDAGYEFTFFDSQTDPYDGNPWEAMRDLRANQSMAVYGTYDGYGTDGLTLTQADVADNPMLQDTGIVWKDQSGVERPVLANDLFRAVHDAFGHGIEGAGFRARGEENAWQAHVRLFEGSAVAAITTETRGQNSWLNYGPYGEQNRTAKVEDTVFAEQKTGLMPEWTWTENRVGDQAADAGDAQGSAFKRWFRDSKVVDEAGEPLVVYHGGAGDIEVFDTTRTTTRGKGDIPGTFFSADQMTASNYRQRPGGKVYAAYLSLQNPLDITDAIARARSDGLSFGDAKRMALLELDRDVHDGVVFRGDDFNPPEYVAFEPQQIKSVKNTGSFDAGDSRIMYQAFDLRSGESDLSEYGIIPGKRYKTRRIAAALQARARALYGTIDRQDRSDETAKKIAEWMAAEVAYEVRESEANGNSAVGWYSDKYQAALDSFAEIYPELSLEATDFSGVVFEDAQDARNYFTALIAITSDGEKVYTNFRRAKDLYAQARETGIIPEDTKATRGVSMRTNAKIINRLYAEHGAGMRDFLLEEFTASEVNREIRAHNKDLPKSERLGEAKYPAKRTLPRSAIYFGPKLGAFYANLSGAEGYLTMDRWWSRTFNRYRGDLLDSATPNGIRAVRILVTADSLGMRPMPAGIKGKAREAWLDDAEAKIEQAAPGKLAEMSDDQVLSVATEYASSYGDKGFKNGTSIEVASNTIYKAAFEGLNDDPFNTSDRGFMIDATNMAQGILREQGVDMSIADIQAILWYYEKRLYAEMGARATPDVSYEEVARRIIEETRDDRGQRSDGELVVRGPDGGGFPAGVGAEAEIGQEQSVGSESRSKRLYQRGAAQAPAGSARKAGPTDALPPVTSEDLQGLIDGSPPAEFFDRPGWAILSATQDWGNDPFGDRFNERAEAQLREDLDRLEIPYVEQTGFYKGKPDGTSFLIIANTDAAERLGKQYKQESILTNAGLVYTNRPQAVTPLTGEVTFGEEAKKSEYYSSMRGGLAYSLDLDFNQGAGVPVYQPGYTQAHGRPQLPVNAEGLVELHHWGPEGLTTVDPSKAGTGPLRGAERSAGQSLSFFGINPKARQRDPGTGYVKEGGLPDNHYIAEVDPDRLYPWYEDPDGFGERLTGDTLAARRVEKTERIRDAGYIGYYVTDDGSMRAPLGNVATLFEEVPVKPFSQRLYQRPQYRRNPVISEPYIPDRGVWDQIHAANGIWAKWDGVKGALMDKVDVARFYLQDRFLPVLRAQEAIEKAIGQKLPESANPYLNEMTYAGRVGRKLRVIDEEYLTPIVKIISKTDGMTTQSVSDYLYALHAKERNDYLEAMDTNSQDDLSGMTNADADAIIQAVDAGPSARQYKEISRLVQKLNKLTMQTRVDAGLLSAKDASAWEQNYQHYVPLKGFAETDHYDMQLSVSGASSRYNVSGPESKRALGRKSRAFQPLQAVFTQAQEVAIRAEKNAVGTTLLNLVQTFPSSNLWEVKKPEMKRFINKRTGLIETRPMSPLLSKLGENEMAVKVDGKEVRMVFKDPRLALSVGTVNANSVNLVTQILSPFSRYFSAVTTMLDPSFVVRNAFRDVITASINITSFGGKDAGAIRKAMLRDWWSSMNIVYQGQKSLDTSARRRPAGIRQMSQADLELYKEFEESGGKVWFWNLQPAEEASADLDQRVYLSSGNVLTRAGKLVMSPDALTTIDRNPFLKGVEGVNLAVDNAIRFAAYKEARNRGWSKAEAAALSKDLTVNFNRRGLWTPTLNAAFPFFNAAVQGSHILIKAMAMSRKTQALVVGMVGMGILEDMINAYNSEEDEDGELAYDKIPNYKLEMSTVIVDPDGQGATTIPLPYGYNVFPYMGKQIGKAMRGVKPGDEAMADVMSAAFAAFSPMWMDAGEDQGINMIKLFSPTATDPLVEVALNKDWMGRPIMPINPYGDYGPDAYKFFGGASDSSLWIADALNRATGGTRVEAGAIDVSPETIDHLLTFAAGGAGRFVGRVTETTTNLLKGDFEAIQTYRVPIARQLRTDTGDYSDKQRYYTFRERAKEAAAAAKEAKEFGEKVSPERAALASLSGHLKLAEKQMKVIRKQRKEAGRDATTDQRNAWLEKEGRIARTFNKKYIEKMGPQAE